MCRAVLGRRGPACRAERLRPSGHVRAPGSSRGPGPAAALLRPPGRGRRASARRVRRRPVARRPMPAIGAHRDAYDARTSRGPGSFVCSSARFPARCCQHDLQPRAVFFEGRNTAYVDTGDRRGLCGECHAGTDGVHGRVGVTQTELSKSAGEVVGGGRGADVPHHEVDSCDDLPDLLDGSSHLPRRAAEAGADTRRPIGGGGR